MNWADWFFCRRSIWHGERYFFLAAWVLEFRPGMRGAMTQQRGDDFEAIAKLIEEAGHPFPVTHIRRLVLRATARTPASKELATRIEVLNKTLGAIAEVIEEIGDGHNDTRHDALAYLWALKRMCQKSSSKTVM